MQQNNLITSITEPFSDNPVGSDPKYNEDFLTVKREIEKLSGTDYSLVQRLSQKILLEQSKDLRVAGYLLLANSFLHGIPGFIEGLKLYESLLKNFWQTIYPQKITAKLNAVKWLNHPKLITYITEKESPALHEIAPLIEAIHKLNSTIAQHVGENLYVLQSLEQWLHNRQKVLQSQVTVKSEKMIDATSALGEINSEQQINLTLTKIIQWYSQQKLYIPAAAYARALRWGNLQLPPHENYLTRLPSPRANGLTQLKNLIKANNAESIFQQCEALLLEPSYHVYLDLQRYAWDAAKTMENDELCIYLQTELIGLIQRFPELIKLQFVDQTAFADATTIAWLEELSTVKNKSNDLPIENRNVDFFIFEVKKKTNSKTNLAKLLNNIAQMASCNTLEEFHKKYAIAKLCLEYRRTDLAVPIFEKLFKLTQAYHLSYWNSDFATVFWYEYYQALELHLKKVSENIRSTLSQRMHELKQLICQTDTAKAISLFKSSN